MITSTPVSACTVPMYSNVEARVIELAQDILRASSARGLLSATLSSDKGLKDTVLTLSIYGEICKEYPHIRIEDINSAISYETNYLGLFVRTSANRVALRPTEGIVYDSKFCNRCGYPICSQSCIR